MFDTFVSLFILFFVIFDPLSSAVVFMASTKKMKEIDKRKTATLAIAIAAILSFIFLFSGDLIIRTFNTNINDLRVAGGIILGILGIKMALGQSITDTEKIKGSAKALASIIGTPLLTGPAAITAIIVTTHDYGMLLTGTSMSVVLLLSLAILYACSWVVKRFGETTIQVMSTLMGLITIAWAITFIKTGLGF